MIRMAYLHSSNRREFSLAALFTGFAFATGSGAFGETTAKLRVAAIGHTGRGDFGHEMDTLWSAAPGVEVVAVADADATGLEKAKDRLGVSLGFSDYEKMLSEVKPDIVSIAPRHVDQHRDMALAAIQAGVKGIYMEKPFCRNLGEAAEILEAAKKKNVKIALAHRNRYHPVLPVVKKLVADGTIGRLLEIRGRGKEDARGGVLDLWVLGSHVLNLAVYFSGEPVACSATLLKAGKPVMKADVVEGSEGVGPVGGDELHARFETKSGVPVFFESIQNAGVKEANFGLQLIGTKGVIDLRIDLEPLAQMRMGNPFQPVREASPWVPITSGGVGMKEPVADIRKQVGGHLAAVRDLIESIQQNRSPLCSAEDGAMTVQMIFAVFESHRQNGQRVPMPVSVKNHPLADLE